MVGDFLRQYWIEAPSDVDRRQFAALTLVVGLKGSVHFHDRSDLNPLKTTIRLALMSANMAIHSVACPVRARTMNTAFIPTQA